MISYEWGEQDVQFERQGVLEGIPSHHTSHIFQFQKPDILNSIVTLENNDAKPPQTYS